MKHYLGVDIGTFETKGVIVSATGEIVAQAARAHRMQVPQPGWAEHDAEQDWWGDFVHVTRKMLADSGIAPSSVAGIGASGIGPCMLPVDEAGSPLMNAVLYGVDTRAAREIEELTRQIGADVILERCGNALTSQAVGPKMLWLKRNRPEVFAKTRKILNSSSFLVHRLTGRYTIDHYSAGNFSPFYLVDRQGWSGELAPGIIAMEQLPELMWTTEIAGHVTTRAAAETGLAEGTPVIAGTIDAAAEAVSVGVLNAGDLMLMYGSTIFIILITGSRVRDGRLWYAPWLFPGQHGSMAGLSTSGTLTHWFRGNFAKDLPRETAVIELAKEAEASPPGAKGLVLLPYFSGERTPIHDTKARGILFGLDLTHDRGDMFRAVLEGIAHGTRHVFETYAEAGQAPRIVYAVGGGTKNRVWGQATSDITGSTQVLRQKTIGASYGDAFLAALALGDVTPADIENWNPVASSITPRPELKAMYDRQHAVFRGLYPATKGFL
ncbi:MAG: FGGY-family carbohydrate kinase [Aestuariivirga sp.]|uniref:FGGY-family carbohydrate kinase n=1 Tax=Aestuariivirga sp. TaxID=2650926 RepID=UPI0025C4CFE5|nr:FGGY-family carbohydrate kinase [Aestuariivirga sp.]MCA3561569.1 FGGY-family carbohydrate kinase [Aestuariivirga sp.]